MCAEPDNIITVDIWGQHLTLGTHPALFSPRGADRGTMAMLSLSEPRPDDRVLDLGCGYGLVGLAAAMRLSPAQVVMVDSDPLAVLLARQNALRNGLDGVRVIEGDGPVAAKPDTFTLILCNPPYHTDFSVARRLIEQSRERLAEGGRLVLVVKRLAWYKNKMAAVFGGVQVRAADDYFVLTSEKRPLAGQSAEKRADVQSTRKHQKKLEAALVRKRRPRRRD